jgi:hypothetical protein
MVSPTLIDKASLEASTASRLDPLAERFDLFKALEAEDGDASALVLQMFESLDLLGTFNIDSIKFQELIRGAQKAYTEKRHRGDGPPPYHSFIHAVDVTQCACKLLQQTEARILLPKELQLATLLAALMHDCGHGGVNTAFLVNTGDRLVQQYGAEGTMELMHADINASFLTHHMAEGRVLGHLPCTVKATLLSSVDDIILATDMSKHQLLMEQMRILAGTDVYTAALRAIHAGAINGGGRSAAGLLEYDDAMILSKYIVKCADISNIARPFGISRVWARRLKREFSAQGRLEHAHGIAVSPMNNFEGESESAGDGESAGDDGDGDRGFVPGAVPSMVLGFMQFLGCGAFSLLAEVLPSNDRGAGFGFAQWTHDQVTANQRLWQMSKDVGLATAAAAAAALNCRSASSKGESAERRHSDPDKTEDKENYNQHNYDLRTDLLHMPLIKRVSSTGAAGAAGAAAADTAHETCHKATQRRRMSCPPRLQVQCTP